MVKFCFQETRNVFFSFSASQLTLEEQLPKAVPTWDSFSKTPAVSCRSFRAESQTSPNGYSGSWRMMKDELQRICSDLLEACSCTPFQGHPETKTNVYFEKTSLEFCEFCGELPQTSASLPTPKGQIWMDPLDVWQEAAILIEFEILYQNSQRTPFYKFEISTAKFFTAGDVTCLPIYNIYNKDWDMLGPFLTGRWFSWWEHLLWFFDFFDCWPLCGVLVGFDIKSAWKIEVEPNVTGAAWSDPVQHRRFRSHRSHSVQRRSNIFEGMDSWRLVLLVPVSLAPSVCLNHPTLAKTQTRVDCVWIRDAFPDFVLATLAVSGGLPCGRCVYRSNYEALQIALCESANSWCHAAEWKVLKSQLLVSFVRAGVQNRLFGPGLKMIEVCSI